MGYILYMRPAFGMLLMPKVSQELGKGDGWRRLQYASDSLGALAHLHPKDDEQHKRARELVYTRGGEQDAMTSTRYIYTCVVSVCFRGLCHLLCARSTQFAQSGPSGG